MRIQLLAGSILILILGTQQSRAQGGKDLSSLFEEFKNAHDTMKPIVLNKIVFYYGSRDRFDSALYYAKQSLALSQKLGNDIGIGNSYSNIANIYRFYSDFDRAIDLYTKALGLYEKRGAFKKASQTMGAIANVFGDLHQYKKEEEKLLETIHYIKSNNIRDTAYLINIYASLADNLINSNQLVSAKNYLDTAITLYRSKKQYPYKNGVDSLQFNFAAEDLFKKMAKQLFAERKYDSSIVMYTDQLKKMSNENGVFSSVELLMGLTDNYLAKNDYESALRSTDVALELLKKDNIPRFYMQVYELRSKIFEKMGRYGDAFVAFRNYKRFNDSIVNSENLKIIYITQEKYEGQKKDQEIGHLNQQKKSQKIMIMLAIAGIAIVLVLLGVAYRAKRIQKKYFRQREDLIKKEKEIELNNLQKKMMELEQMALRAQMNPHFIFNSLNSVQHFVIKQDVEGVNRYLGAFAHLIRQTLNNSGKPLISLSEEIKYLDTYLSLEKMKSNNRFNYFIKLEDDVEGSTTFIPGMILQPFVENSIRHGITHREKNDGEINIHVSKNGVLLCLIEDNGIGRQKSTEIKKAGDGAEHESRGMAITMNRIDTINKIYDTDISVHIDDILDAENNPAGTRVKVEFPTDMD